MTDHATRPQHYEEITTGNGTWIRRGAGIKQPRRKPAQRSPVLVMSRELCRVYYMVNGKEKRSPWFSTFARGEQALELLKARYGRAILFWD